jgi:hypothetical protein
MEDGVHRDKNGLVGASLLPRLVAGIHMPIPHPCPLWSRVCSAKAESWAWITLSPPNPCQALFLDVVVWAWPRDLSSSMLRAARGGLEVGGNFTPVYCVVVYSYPVFCTCGCGIQYLSMSRLPNEHKELATSPSISTSGLGLLNNGHSAHSVAFTTALFNFRTFTASIYGLS